MKKLKHLMKLGTALAVGLLLVGQSAQAMIIWDWDGGAETGTFTTAGALTVGDLTVTDFSVGTSSEAALLGSVSGGQYMFLGVPPISVNWTGTELNGSFIAQTIPPGGLLTVNFDADQLAITGVKTSNAPLSATPRPVVQVPEPMTLGLALLGLGGLVASRRRANA